MTAVMGDVDQQPERRAVAIAPGFDATPSIRHVRSVEIAVVPDVPGNVDAVAVPVGSDSTGASRLGLEVAALAALGFDGQPGQTHVTIGAGGPLQVAVGVGDPASIDADGIRMPPRRSRSRRAAGRLAVRIPALAHVDPAMAAQVIVEGILLARYAYEPLKRKPGDDPRRVHHAHRRPRRARRREQGRGARPEPRGRDDAREGPRQHAARPSHRPADRRRRRGRRRRPGLEVEVFDQAALTRLGCGGLLGVNGGSADEARMVKLTYRPASRPAGARAPPPRAGRQGDHVRLGRHQPQAVRRRPRAR